MKALLIIGLFIPSLHLHINGSVPVSTLDECNSVVASVNGHNLDKLHVNMLLDSDGKASDLIPVKFEVVKLECKSSND